MIRSNESSVILSWIFCSSSKLFIGSGHHDQRRTSTTIRYKLNPSTFLRSFLKAFLDCWKWNVVLIDTDDPLLLPVLCAAFIFFYFCITIFYTYKTSLQSKISPPCLACQSYNCRREKIKPTNTWYWPFL